MSDLNKVAKLERAIQAKFGSDAVINPEYAEVVPEDRLIEESRALQKKEDLLLHNKRLILSPNRFKRSCDVCAVYSIENHDTLYLSKFGVCFKCYVEHIEDRPEETWRPRLEKLKDELINSKA